MAEARSDLDPLRSYGPVTEGWFLTGPTASGKTNVGLELAERLGAEIISLDSMAVYRGMDLGTAKPTPSQRQRVAHHLLDVVHPHEEFSLSQFVSAAHDAIRDVCARGRSVLFVGGTPLYLKALLRGVYPGPPPDWEFRRQIEAELKTVDLACLHERLRLVDPLSAARLHPHDQRRIIRALEVFRLTGRPLSHAQTHFDEVRRDARCKVIVLRWARKDLHQRIDERVAAMFESGMVHEVRGLLANYGSLGRTASQAVGYREVIEYLHGLHDLAATIELVKRRTRQFARRQDTWFRSLAECQPFCPSLADSPARIAEAILGFVK